MAKRRRIIIIIIARVEVFHKSTAKTVIEQRTFGKECIPRGYIVIVSHAIRGDLEECFQKFVGGLQEKVLLDLKGIVLSSRIIINFLSIHEISSSAT